MGQTSTSRTASSVTASSRVESLRDLAKFTGAVALLAILSDAAIGHALLWENDPYWTYWITKTFLIATVFALGTAWIGTGIARGAVITAVHTIVLTVYYWSLSPIGLPSHPEWLDLQHTWVTGLPVHFGVIYLGYLVALWLWQRRPLVAARNDELGGGNRRELGGDAARALAVGVGLVVVAGGIESVLLEFPGVTWFVVRALIAIPFVLSWWAAAGRDRGAAFGGGLLLALILTTYSHFLGPVGLPDTDLRVVAQDPPPATVHWLTYREEWLVAFPVTAIVAIVAFLAGSGRGAFRPPVVSRPRGLAVVVAIVAVVGVAVVTASEAGPDDQVARVTSAGGASVEIGEFYRGDLERAEGELRLVAAERNPRVTPLPPHDDVDLEASVEHPDGTRYEITATQPLIDDPKGRHGTWWGVGLDRWHHGRSGIGTPLLPPIRSEVAVFALGDVRADGDLVARGVPVHVMTIDDGGVELDVGDPHTPVDGLPDGHLRVVWDDRSGGSPEGHERSHNALGTVALTALLALVITAIRDDEARTTAGE